MQKSNSVLFLIMLLFLGFSCSGTEPIVDENQEPPEVRFAGEPIISDDVEPEVVGGSKKLLRKLDYPAELRKEGIEGNVFVSFIVYRDGTPGNFSKVFSPHPKLYDLVVDALKKVRFKPKMINGEAVNCRYEVKLVFELAGTQRTEFPKRW